VRAAGYKQPLDNTFPHGATNGRGFVRAVFLLRSAFCHLQSYINHSVNLPTEIFDDVIVAHAPDELCSDQAPALEAHLPTLERRSVVLDLEGTEAFDSRGLEALLTAQDKLRQEGGEMKIAVANPANRKILEITRLDQQIEVFESVVEAVRSFH
jgi:anti-anti-sigma factor